MKQNSFLPCKPYYSPQYAVQRKNLVAEFFLISMLFTEQIWLH